MRLDLKSKLLEWRNDDNKIGVRTVNFLPLGEEYLITLSEKLEVSLNNQTKSVSSIVRFQTFAQENNGRNPNGDVQRASQFINIVTNDFNDKYNAAINEMFRDFEGETHELD